ncbi:translation elongation factor Ts [Candidatus Dependentiae bacterium]|nr:translation elongation factor Ts [Candidatus Dependentiae bacterium]
MATVTLELIQQLREKTGLGMMDCKKALQETDGDLEAAIDLLRKKGAAVALKRADKATSEGLVHAYVHPGAKIGVLIELNCETDFVASTTDIKQFAQDICLQITAFKPLYLTPDLVDDNFLQRERDIAREQLAGSGKPEKIIEQIIEGKLKKIYAEICLLEQPYIKNDQLTVNQALQELIAKVGENVKIKRFARFEVGTTNH